MAISKKEIAQLAAAIRLVAEAGEAHGLTVRAIAQSVEAALWEMADEKAKGFRHDVTGVIDLSGRDYLTEIGAK
jgi:hypothetical protein